MSDFFGITPKHSGDLGVATKEPRKGRPAAIGRVLLRLVKCCGHYAGTLFINIELLPL